MSYQSFEVALDISLKRTCTEIRVVACVDNELRCLIAYGQRKLLILKALLQISRLNIYDTENLRLGKRIVEYYLVKSFQ